MKGLKCRALGRKENIQTFPQSFPQCRDCGKENNRDFWPLLSCQSRGEEKFQMHAGHQGNPFRAAQVKQKEYGGSIWWTLKANENTIIFRIFFSILGRESSAQYGSLGGRTLLKMKNSMTWRPHTKFGKLINWNFPEQLEWRSPNTSRICLDESLKFRSPRPLVASSKAFEDRNQSQSQF